MKEFIDHVSLMNGCRIGDRFTYNDITFRVVNFSVTVQIEGIESKICLQGRHKDTGQIIHHKVSSSRLSRKYHKVRSGDMLVENK